MNHLDHAARRAILDRLHTAPREHIGAIATALGVDYKTALYHAMRLARAGHVVLEREGRSRYARLPGSRAPQPLPQHVELTLGALRGGARTPAQLARSLGVPRGTAGSLLVALKRRGLAARSESGWAAVDPR